MHYEVLYIHVLKGTMSEAELHLIKQRMNQGKLNKAKRGELHFDLPTGYIRQPSGEVTLDPDEQVQSVIHLLFRKFNEVGDAARRSTVSCAPQHSARYSS